MACLDQQARTIHYTIKVSALAIALIRCLKKKGSLVVALFSDYNGNVLE